MTDWADIERWDRKYYLHNVQGRDDYAFNAVATMDGNYFTMADGSKLLDFQSQLISDSMGHRHPGAFGELHRAMERYGHVYFGMANEYRARAAKLVVDDILGGDTGWAGRFRVLSSGTEAVEVAISMARLYTGRSVILTQAHSFHGVTVGASMLRGYRNNVTPAGSPKEIRDMPGFPVAGYIPIPPPEFEDFATNGPLPSIAATEHIIRAVGPENIAAVITEPMFGAAALSPHANYLPEVYALCRKYSFLWIEDEVLCGFGRLGDWFGYQHYQGIAPDLMTVGKSINGGALPVGGIVASHSIAEFFDAARWWSGSTWDGHPLVCATIVGNLNFMLVNDMLKVIRARSAYLKQRLDDLAARHPSVGRVAGRGLYFAVDLVDADGMPIVRDDRYSGFTGSIGEEPNNFVGRECARRGLFLGGFVPNSIKVGPPFTITEPEIDFAMNTFDEVLTLVDQRWC
jgi:taurine--2-oxoglutarate transaminase